ncbi:hypothetical protein [Rhizobium sp. K102]|uniref:hypothetical protein n=1 Tax=Rhizobium sp. K102 TaxID=2918527 RepID=UPI001EFB431E|nr:hypothetical protein [Rhizobium sp. K102]ULR47442.1 hypothetical protein MHI61_28505 [Rhizobium sp. K102]
MGTAKLALDLLHQSFDRLLFGGFGQHMNRDLADIRGSVAVTDAIGDGEERGRFRNEQRVGID